MKKKELRCLGIGCDKTILTTPGKRFCRSCLQKKNSNENKYKQQPQAISETHRDPFRGVKSSN